MNLCLSHIMRKYFNLASLFSMLLLVCCSGSVNGSIPDFSIGEESSKPTDEEPVILSYVWHSFKELPDPTLELILIMRLVIWIKQTLSI